MKINVLSFIIESITSNAHTYNEGQELKKNNNKFKQIRITYIKDADSRMGRPIKIYNEYNSKFSTYIVTFSIIE